MNDKVVVARIECLVRAPQWNTRTMEKETRISLGVWRSGGKEEVRPCMDIPYVSPEPVDFGWTP